MYLGDIVYINLSPRIFAFLMACIAFMLTFGVYMKYIYQLGFPDGFISELAYAQRNLSYIFMAISVVVGLSFIYIAVINPKRMVKTLGMTSVLYLLLIVVAFLLNLYYRLNLTGGTGG